MSRLHSFPFHLWESVFKQAFLAFSRPGLTWGAHNRPTAPHLWKVKKMRGIKEIKKDIEELKQHIRLSEIGDDGYYLSKQRKEDELTMAYLREELKQAEQNND